ncbi:MAG: glycosyltransferase [Oscillospiraceae bacterium]|nr:glycosyltransferase [Oscillospiraceae bacterium]
MLTDAGNENYILYCIGQSDFPQGIRYANEREIRIQALRARISGRYGFVSRGITRRLIGELRRLEPDIVHLHNIHSHNCNLAMLFEYLRESGARVIWTMHDCWGFTGYCTHYVMSGCGKWESGCHDCPQRRKFSWFSDRSRELYDAKCRKTKPLDLTLVAPSRWMADQIGRSFLSGHGCCVIPNGIDLNVFRPVNGSFRERHRLEDKYLILGAAFDWGLRKGLDVFKELSERLDDRFRIVLVGTTNEIDKQLPDSIISIHRTADRLELAELYSAADVFLNPTREEVFGMVNIEANACGTPVLTFNTGGCPECIEERSGCVIAVNDIDALEREIVRICRERPFKPEDCVMNAGRFENSIIYKQYFDLYKGIIGE